VGVAIGVEVMGLQALKLSRIDISIIDIDTVFIFRTPDDSTLLFLRYQ